MLYMFQKTHFYSKSYCNSCCFFVAFNAGITSWITLPKNRRMTLVRPFWQFFNYFCLKFLFFVKVYHLDRRSESEKGYCGLFISNHQTITDIFLIGANHPVPALMKREILFIPFFGITAFSAGGIPVNRKNPTSRKKALEECKNRLRGQFGIQTYPEGTRSKTDRPKEFSEIHAGLIFEAYDLGVQVTPISLNTLETVDPDTHLMKPGSLVGLLTSAPVHPKNFKTKEEFAQCCWQKVIDGYDELSKCEIIKANRLN
ncbi:MAG: lysophospholipid acyltransferase family protein [Bacteriovoracaceae bacterium]